MFLPSTQLGCIPLLIACMRQPRNASGVDNAEVHYDGLVRLGCTITRRTAHESKALAARDAEVNALVRLRTCHKRYAVLGAYTSQAHALEAADDALAHEMVAY